MSNIALISCVKKKAKYIAKARDLYTSPFFTKSIKYAESKLKPDKIFILSAKYGLLNLYDEIEPYDETLNNKSREAQRKWAYNVFLKISKECDIKNDNFIFLAGKDYYQDLITYLPNTEIPMAKIRSFKRVQWLNRKLDE